MVAMWFLDVFARFTGLILVFGTTAVVLSGLLPFNQPDPRKIDPTPRRPRAKTQKTRVPDAAKYFPW